VSGALVLVTVLEARHPGAGSVGARIVGAVVIWLLFAAVIRLVILVAQRGRRFWRPGDTPEAPKQ